MTKSDGVLIKPNVSGITFEYDGETFTLEQFVQRFLRFDMEIDILAQEIEDTRTELAKRYHDIADDNLSTFAAYIACGYAPADIDALIAENERLRAENDAMRHDLHVTDGLYAMDKPIAHDDAFRIEHRSLHSVSA